MKSFTEQLLDQLPPPGDPVSVADLAEALGEPTTKRVVRSIDVLRRRGLVERLEPGCYRLTSSGEETRAAGERIVSGPRKPHSGPVKKKAPFREALWKALRLEEATTVQDLISLIPEEAHGSDPRSNAYAYLRRLIDAHYVIELPSREPGTAITSNGFKRYRLIRNTGPAAPHWSAKSRKLVDPNLPAEVIHD
ncbi:MAG: hypothetical protein RH946_00610 [Rhodospirillales bacterium]